MTDLGKRRFYELRVHGVAGTPPAGMLGMRPEPVDPPPDTCGQPKRPLEIGLYSRPSGGEELRAFSWGSLTSGSRRTAFYVLLLPYMLANVAGWMMLPLPQEGATLADPDARRSGPLRVVTLLVRLAGLLVTFIFALSTYLIVTDLGAYQWLVRGHGWPAWWVGIGVLVTAGAVLLLFYFTRVRLPHDARYKDPWSDEADPVGYAWIHHAQAELWSHPGIIVRLRWLHLAAAWASIALVAALARPWLPGGEWQAWDRGAVGLAIAALALAVLLMCVVTLGRGAKIPPWVSRAIRWVSWSLALVAVLVSAARIAGIGAPGPGQFLPAIRGGSAWVALAYLLLVLTAGLLGWIKRSQRDVPRRAGWNLPGLLLLAAATSSGVGAALALQAARLLGGCDRLEGFGGGTCPIAVGSSGDWLAIAFTTGLAVLGATLLVRFLAAYRTHRSAEQRVMVAVRAVLDRASWLLAMVVILGFVAIAAGLSVAAAKEEMPSTTSLPGSVELLITVLLVAPIVVVAFWLTGRVEPLGLRLLAILGLGALIGFTVVAVANGWEHSVLGLSVPPRTFLELAQLAGLLPLTLLVTRFLYAGLEDRSIRRGVGILWDIGTFWPRWFHPFAPPTYSDRAVVGLRRHLDQWLTDPSCRVLLAAHSQGSIIGAAAVLGMAEARCSQLAFLTYGSPWSRFYVEFYPAMFSTDCLSALCKRLGAGAGGRAVRWRNLYRISDPIGGPIRGNVDNVALDDECGLVHSSYDLEPAYQQAARDLREQLLRDEEAHRQQEPEGQDEAGGGGEGGQQRGTLGGAGQQA